MNIALGGAHGTGKTTLIESLCDQYSKGCDVRTISGIPRMLIGLGFPFEKNANANSYFTFIKEQLKREQMDYASVPGTVMLSSDRTVLDALTYATINNQYGFTCVEQYVVDALREVWLAEAPRYDVYVIVPIEFPITDDGIRDIDEAYRASVAREIRAIMTDICPVPYLVVTGSVEERCQQVRAFIGD
jgi:predicted ATPase